MGVTANYTLPYPEDAPGVPNQVPLDVKALADATDGALQTVQNSIQSRMRIVKSNITSITSATLPVEDAELTIDLIPAGTWIVTGAMFYEASTTSDLKTQVNVSAGVTGRIGAIGLNNVDAMSVAETMIATQLGWGGAGSARRTLQICGSVTVPTDSSIAIAWAQLVSGATATRVFPFSFLAVEKV